MDGFVAVTDPGWYERLSRESGPPDANFWRPSARRFNLAVGTPFLFKLKAPHNVIAGFGFFAGFSILPDWLAWDTFGEGNGVERLDMLRARLRRIQDGARIEANACAGAPAGARDPGGYDQDDSRDGEGGETGAGQFMRSGTNTTNTPPRLPTGHAPKRQRSRSGRHGSSCSGSFNR